MAPALLFVVCWLVLFSSILTRGQVTSATYNVVDVHLPLLPNAAPVYVTGAVMTLVDSQPLYIRAGLCQQNLLCNSTNFVRCCADSDCDPLTLSRLPSAPTDCACPSFPGSICVDPSRPYTFGEQNEEYLSTAPNGFIFEIPIARACRNTIVNTNAIRGSFGVSLGTASQTPFEVRSFNEKMLYLEIYRSFIPIQSITRVLMVIMRWFFVLAVMMEILIFINVNVLSIV